MKAVNVIGIIAAVVFLISVVAYTISKHFYPGSKVTGILGWVAVCSCATMCIAGIISLFL